MANSQYLIKKKYPPPTMPNSMLKPPPQTFAIPGRIQSSGSLPPVNGSGVSGGYPVTVSGGPPKTKPSYSELYTHYLSAVKALPGQMAALGLYGTGAAESSLLRLQAAYGTAIADRKKKDEAVSRYARRRTSLPPESAQNPWENSGFRSHTVGSGAAPYGDPSGLNLNQSWYDDAALAYYQSYLNQNRRERAAPYPYRALY